MNWLDRVIEAVSPEAGLRRRGARAALTTLRAYDAAKTGRRTSGWRATGTSANAEAMPSIATVRNRSRELVRNNPHALRAINILAAKSIGTGIQARWPSGAAGAWKEFADTCDLEGDMDLAGLQTMVARASFESGECIIRRVRERSGRIPIKLQVLEPDYLDSLKFGKAGQNEVIGGVEIDSLGRKVAYWLYPQHPGDSHFTTYTLQSQRVPAADIILFGEKLRPGQLRYMPRLAASMMRLRDFDDYRDALIVKKKIEACFAAFVIGGTPSVTVGEATTDSTTGQRTETLSPGIIEYVGNGSDVKFANPSTGSDDGFSLQELHAIAAGAGVTYAQLTGDLSQVNYSSIRAGMADFRDLVEAWRWVSFIPMAMRRISDWFLEAAWTAGTIRTMNYAPVWTPPAWPYVNPVDDIKAAKEEVLAGMQSLSEKIRERGYDPDLVFAEIHAERDKLEKMGIVVDTDAEVTHKVAEPAASAEPDPAATAAADAADKAAREAERERREDQRSLTLALTRALEAPRATPNVSVSIAEGAVRSETHVQPPVIPAPEVRVENTVQAAVIPAPAVRVENNVAPTPIEIRNDVTVNPAAVVIDGPLDMNIKSMPDRETTSSVERNGKGEITSTKQTEKDA